MKPLLIYCYDAYCGWCYGFSPVIKKIAEAYQSQMDTEVISGGMILPEQPVHIGVSAAYINKAYKLVEERTGIQFGSDYLWHIQHPDDSDWYPNSEKPAIALCVFKTYFPERAIEFAADLQYSLHYEGRDLTDDESYRHLLDKYEIPPDEFYAKLKEPQAREDAYYEFALAKQLKVTGYPTVFIQKEDGVFHLIAQGFTEYETLKERIEQVLKK